MIRLFDSTGGWDAKALEVSRRSSELLSKVFAKLTAEYPDVHLRDLEYVMADDIHVLFVEHMLGQRDKGLRPR